MKSLIATIIIAMALTLYVRFVASGVQYPIDAAAVVAWMGVSYELTRVIP